MNNPYQSPTQSGQSQDDLAFRVQKLERRTKRLRWCVVAAYFPAIMALTFYKGFAFAVGPVETGVVMMAGLTATVLLVTR